MDTDDTLDPTILNEPGAAGGDDGDDTIYLDPIDEESPLIVESKEDNRTRAFKKIEEKFYNFDPLNSPFSARIDDEGVWVRLTDRSNNREHLLIDSKGDLVKYDRLPETIKRSIGMDSQNLVLNNNKLIADLNEANEEIKDLRNALDGLRAVTETSQFEIDRYVTLEKELRGIIERHQTRIAESESYLETAVKEKVDARLYAETLLNDLKVYKDEIDKNKKDLASLKKIEQNRDSLVKRVNTYEELAKNRIISNQEQISDLERQNDEIRDKMPLRDRVKAIFKKYGFTVFAVMSAVGVVIGVIVSNLSKGLSKLGKGVGDGLKTLGKKLGEILPGMVGAIVSFLFKTAGEAISFLGKHAWLLIMAVVLYFIEELKRKRK